MRSPTRYKFRHYRNDQDNVRKLIWASDGPGRSEELDVVKGSELDLEIKNSQLWTSNALANEGEIDMLDVYFDAQAVRANLYFRLWATTLVDTSTDASGTEVTGTGYDGIAVARGTDWTAPAHDTGTTQPTAKTFTAGGTWTGATDLALCTLQNTTGGLLIAYAALSATRTLLNTDTLDVDMTVSLE